MRRLVLLFLTTSLALLPPCSLAAQQGGPLQPPTTGGLPVLLQELRMLGHNKRVLLIGAHPDDEDTELLVMLTRREGAEAAYLSLTRGEGGQNLIGNELGEALGILRTEELMAARNIDGAQQFFTRAYDFGYSKTLADTWAHWPKDSVLKDVVRIVRRFRPQVIVSVFSGTPRDGHGQHQASGWAAQEAFRIAGDSTRFPELATEEGLRPFTPTKLYLEAWFHPEAATLTLDGGEVEKLSGKTYHQLAMMGRSLHRSQDMGRLQEFGPSLSRLTFKASRSASADVGEGWGAFWSGVDTVLKVPSDHFQALAEARAAAGRDPVAVGTALSRAGTTLIPWGGPVPNEHYEHLATARQVVSWVFVDAIAERARIAPEDTLGVRFVIRNAGRRSVRLGPITLVGPGGLNTGHYLRDSILPGATEEVTLRAGVQPTDKPSAPYYLKEPRVGDLYSWGRPEQGHWGPVASWMGQPRGRDELVAHVLGGDELFPAAPVSERVLDQAVGEIRRPVVIVPRIGVKLSPGIAIVRTAATGQARTVTVDISLESGTPSETRGRVTVELPNGWPRPTPVPFTLKGVGAATNVTMRVMVPANAGEGQYPIRAVATDGAGKRYDIGAFMVDYPHIRPQQYTRPATGKIEVVDLVTPPVRRIGYVRGAADRIPEALAGAGLNVTLLDSVYLSTGDLSTYDAIVIGPRAYEIDSALVRNNDRLLAYARDGGRVVVQYQQQVYLNGGFAPYPLSGNSRIADERSPVTMLGASASQSALAPVFRTPNAIGSEDWEGWIQDRALYCPTSWGPEFHPLLAMNDPGEAPIRGCLLESTVGRGSYVYTGLAFFRELPAGVPGAYRLFFNLLGGKAVP